MYTKHRLRPALYVLCCAGLAFGALNADASTPHAPLMPTKDPAIHQSPMQQYLLPGRLPSARYNPAMMVPLMPTKDRLAHKSSPMQFFPWSRQYHVLHPTTHGLIGVAAPLMPTRDPEAHQGDMQQDLLS